MYSMFKKLSPGQNRYLKTKQIKKLSPGKIIIDVAKGGLNCFNEKEAEKNLKVSHK